MHKFYNFDLNSNLFSSENLKILLTEISLVYKRITIF